MRLLVIHFSILWGCAPAFEGSENVVSPTETKESDTGTAEDTGEASDEPSNEASNEPSEEIDPLDIDDDEDGYSENEGDCDDSTDDISPDNFELPYDGLDNDCDPSTPDDDLDGDGYDLSDDCDDYNPNVYPEALDDQCDYFDDNCNGVVDDDWMDSLEPNNSWTYPNESASNYLGRLDTGAGIFEMTNYHSPANDVDQFVFFNDDGIGWDFDFTITAYNVPSTLDLHMNLYYYDADGNYQGLVAESDGNGYGTNVEIYYQGDSGDNTGYYVVEMLSNVGEDCSTPYTLKMVEN